MNEPRHTPASRWAPWWAYLVPILALNYLRLVVLPPDETGGDAVSVALAAAITLAVVLVVTALHRARGRA
jgi:hypothetical protein